MHTHTTARCQHACACIQAGFKNNIPGAASFSAGLIVPAGDSTTVGGAWKSAGPNLASGSNCSAGFCYAPENPVVTTMSTDGKFYLAVCVLHPVNNVH
jgi:hypothetical protein